VQKFTFLAFLVDEIFDSNFLFYYQMIFTGILSAPAPGSNGPDLHIRIRIQEANGTFLFPIKKIVVK
jgi:hypothetical protein